MDKEPKFYKKFTNKEKSHASRQSNPHSNTINFIAYFISSHRQEIESSLLYVNVYDTIVGLNAINALLLLQQKFLAFILTLQNKSAFIAFKPTIVS